MTTNTSYEFIELVNIRTQLQNKLIGFGCAVFLGIVMATTLIGSHRGEDVSGALAVWIPMLVVILLFTARAFFAGTILLLEDQMRYRSVLRTRWISRVDLTQADSGVRTRFPSPRKMMQPVLRFTNGGELWLIDFSIALSDDINGVRKTSQKNGLAYRQYESQDDMLMDLNEWLARSSSEITIQA
jgi:hypothetical protein